MKNDMLGDRMKEYEARTGGTLIPLIPTMARIDGRCFSSFTRGLERPYDIRMVRAMVGVTKYLVEETNALVGYTQSDEITLVWLSTNYKSQIFFAGRIQKMVSNLASMATIAFYRHVQETFPTGYADRLPTFDCRVWNVPTQDEAVNCLIWREQDATRNSILSAGRHYFSHKQLNEKDTSEVQEMLWSQHGVNWNDYPAYFRRGSYIQTRTVKRPFTVDEIDKLPEKHAARTNPNLEIERREVRALEVPPLRRIANREGFVFRGEDPQELVEQQAPAEEGRQSA